MLLITLAAGPLRFSERSLSLGGGIGNPHPAPFPPLKPRLSGLLRVVQVAGRRGYAARLAIRRKRAAARFAVDQELLGPYVIGLFWNIESTKDHRADDHMARIWPRTRNRYVQARPRRLLFEVDGDDLAEGQIDEFRRRGLICERLILDVLLTDPTEYLPGHRMRTRTRHGRVELRAFGVTNDYRHRLCSAGSRASAER